MDRVDVFLEPVRAFLVQIGAYLPRLGMALLIVLAGWLLAKALRFAVQRALRAINFDVLTRRAGIDGFLEQGGVEGDTADLLAWLSYWIAIVLSLVIAFNGLGLGTITELLGRVLAFLPRVALAIVVLAIGLYFARFVGGTLTVYLRNAQIQDADLLGRLAQYAVVVFVVLVGLDVLDVGGGIVRLTFLILLGGVVLAFALAFGLGGQRWAGALLERWWPTGRREDRDEQP
ncbi:MAG: hypothetical protein IT532_05900 [Burkholderiales bacterium]|nr:hypothetical protein [Burkholderiales bacterium]